MAERSAQGADVLKQFAAKVTVSSTKERIGATEAVVSHIKNGGLPELAVRGIFRFLTSTVGRYQDAASRRAAYKLVAAVVRAYPELSVTNIVTALSSFVDGCKKNSSPCKSSSGDSLYALSMTCVALRDIWSAQSSVPEDTMRQLVALQCVLVYGACAVDRKVISQAAYRKLRLIWISVPGSLERYLGLLEKVEASVFSACIMAFVLQFLSATKNKALIDKYKGAYLDLYLKQVLASRTTPPPAVVVMSREIVRHCSHEEFKGQVLPAAQRAMLRNPEIILSTVGEMLSQLSVDLSQYAADLGKLLGAQMVSKDEGTRREAVCGVRNLAVQCSDPGAVERLVKHFFAVLNGSEGKLTVADQKVSVLQGIGNLVHNTVSGTASVQDLATKVTEMFLPTLQQEVHEGTLVHALSMLSLWCSKFYTSVPDKLLLWFEKGLTLKSATSAVRNAYFLCMNACFHGDTMQQATQVVPLLLQTLEKAGKQPGQLTLVTEVVSASRTLVSLASVDIDCEAKLGPFWSMVLEPGKQWIVADKFLASASDETLRSVVWVTQRLVQEFPQRVGEEASRPFLGALLHCLTHRSWGVRAAAGPTVRKLLASLGGAKVALALVAQFKAVLDTQSLSALRSQQEGEEEVKGGEDSKVIKPRILCRALLSVCSVEKVDTRDAEAIAMATLLPAHHPYIMFGDQDVWVEILQKLNLNPGRFVEKHATQCLALAQTGTALSQSMREAVETLCRVCPEAVVPPLVEYVCGLLSTPDLVHVTRDDYGIFLTPEGELYDRSIIENAKKSSGAEQNVRRENKLYSYAEQMAELELRKEMEKKKVRKAEEMPKLTKKQEELLAAQRQRESETRHRLNQLYQQLCCGCGLLSAALNGAMMECCFLMNSLCDVLVPLLSSPLAAPSVTNVFLLLGKVAFHHCRIGILVSNVTLRLLEPACSTPREWAEEPLPAQSARAVSILLQSVGPEPEAIDLLPASAVGFIYYLLAAVLKNGAKVVNKNVEVCSEALQLVALHADMRRSPDLLCDRRTLLDPDLLPRHKLMALCLSVIGTMEMDLQQKAATALLKLAACANGDDDAATATQPEVLELLGALESPCTAVREAALQSLRQLYEVLPEAEDDQEVAMQVAKRVWIACNDEDESIQQIAKELREDLDLESPQDGLHGAVLEDVDHQVDLVRKACALTLAQVLHAHPHHVPSVLTHLLHLYEQRLYLPPAKVDPLGRKIEEQPPDQWPARSGVALALAQIAPLLPQAEVGRLFDFYVPKALGDRSPEVRSHMRDAALAAINSHGKENVGLLLPVFENFLATAPDTASNDTVRQSIVILMGNLARHLDTDNPKVKPIVAQLISALSTPSQEVQEAVANCLPPLVPSIKQGAPELVRRLQTLLLESENYGERRGAAYGLAGLVKGMGILALKQQQVMDNLTAAIQDKKNPRKREGALLAFEMLCNMLGRLFEPYIVHIIQHLLLCFGDGNQYVREAADECAKAVMRNLSAHGVKLVLPSLLRGLEEDSWRTKAGSVELLGAMAFCAPKQLSACLPSIVPKLTEVLTDSHAKVQNAGSQALQQIGSVIRNPEIQAIVPTLLEALQEPTKRTTVCLQRLLATKFVHFVDAPSLALIMPVIQRAFQDRVTETRKMAAQIMGNMYSLTDQKDLSPYLPAVIPGLKQCLLDPVPEVRSVSARALGAMVKGMGEGTFDDLLPWLMEKLVSEVSSVDRSGAAQGLSEVIGGMGLDKLDKLMHDIIGTAERGDILPCVRDGYIMTYIYLPAVFGTEFARYVGPILPSILQALADESEFVRDTALRAGQRIISQYADTAIELLLPELERGLFDDNWRIRYSSVQLLGDLLYKVSGVSGKMTTETADEDDNFGTENSQKAIMSALGDQRRNRVLSGLYMGRSDTALLVRQSALHVWKVIVHNTPRTLREILPTLFSLLLGCLASTSHDKRTVAARTLGDLVRKLGERVLPEIIPILERGLDSEEADQRQGVCIGLSEIMSSTSREHVTVFADSLVPTVRRALCDPLPQVRQVAAVTFDHLHANIGQRALDEILPFLLRQLEDSSMSEQVLDGLKQVMSVKSRVVLPYLIPQLTAPPVNTKALSLLTSVAGDALTRHLGKILPALLASLSAKRGTPDEDQELEYCKKVVLSVTDEVGVRTIMEELLGSISTASTGGGGEDAVHCWSVVTLLQALCSNSAVGGMGEYLPQLFRGLLQLFVRTDPPLLLAAWNCLDSITKKLDTSEMLPHIASVRQAVRFAASDFKGKELPGFSIPKKGIAPVLPIFREGILNGAQEVKEAAALGLGEVIALTSAEALKPSVVNITGPLIRILGDRFTWNVKVAVLETLTLLLSKVGMFLKPFLPQLQTTFIKALNDPNRSVRLKAATALGKLIVIHVRVDPLFTELCTGIKTTDDTSIRDTYLQAIRCCLHGAGAKMAEPLRRQMALSLLGLLTSPEDSTRMTAAGCFGSLCAFMSEAEVSDTMEQLMDTDMSVDWTLRQGRCCALGVVLKECPDKVWPLPLRAALVNTVSLLALADRIPICLGGVRAVGYLLRHLLQKGDNSADSHSLAAVLVKCLKNDSTDVKQLVGRMLTYVGDGGTEAEGGVQGEVLRVVVPALVMGTKEKNTMVRAASESALVTLLRLRHGDAFYQSTLSSLDAGMQDSLREVYAKSLKKLATQTDPGVEDIDDTVLR
ncbi:stalled ribosome sensor GCN1-like [Babylonia areolata]|uniref:stalled ribosome sensor GCN1-like n=1 Tax=Babylonia areolata TaxID=304850 RepID=UPI003FD6201C